jgi:transglutaminase-like putative cysteine protease
MPAGLPSPPRPIQVPLFVQPIAPPPLPTPIPLRQAASSPPQTAEWGRHARSIFGWIFATALIVVVAIVAVPEWRPAWVDNLISQTRSLVQPSRSEPSFDLDRGAGHKWASSNSSYETIDRHALAATPKDEESVAALAAYLAEPAKNDAEKSRAIYRWVTDRVAYDVEEFFSGKKTKPQTAESVLKARLGVCAGYSSLFHSLCKEVGVESVIVHGCARGLSYKPGAPIKSNHAWNAIKLDGAWYLVDSTWGAGHVNDAKLFVKRFDDFYFLTPPDRLICSHFPDDPSRQFLSPPVLAARWQRWPQIPQELLSDAADFKEIVKLLDLDDFRGFPMAFMYEGPKLTLLSLPLCKHLQSGASYQFRIKAPGRDEIVLIMNGRYSDLTRNGDVFEATVTPDPGKLNVAVRGTKHPYSIVLQYEVE